MPRNQFQRMFFAFVTVVEYKIFSGSVINTRTVITFQGASVEELNKEFQQSVDDYLEWCKEDGIDPEKPYSGKFNVRLNKDCDEAVGESDKEICRMTIMKGLGYLQE